MSKSRTDKQIVSQTNEIARILYRRIYGCQVKKGTDFHTEKGNRHPYERICWESACEIQEFLTETDVQNSLDNLNIK